MRQDIGTFAAEKRLRRNRVLDFGAGLPTCLSRIEACGTSPHWAREIEALSPKVRPIPRACVKPRVKRQKTDRADAEAICEAASTTCPTSPAPRASALPISAGP